MLHQDYLVRMFMVLAAAIRRSLLEAERVEDPAAAADLLEAALSNATEVDGTLLLKMDPDTMVTMLKISNTDPKLIGFVARTLLLESTYLDQMQSSQRAELRRNQAFALASAYGFDLCEKDVSPQALETFFDEELPSQPEGQEQSAQEK